MPAQRSWGWVGHLCIQGISWGHQRASHQQHCSAATNRKIYFITVLECPLVFAWNELFGILWTEVYIQHILTFSVSNFYKRHSGTWRDHARLMWIKKLCRKTLKLKTLAWWGQKSTWSCHMAKVCCINALNKMGETRSNEDNSHPKTLIVNDIQLHTLTSTFQSSITFWD